MADARADESGDRRLVGYVVPAGGRTVDPTALRTHLAEYLPAYMIPAFFVELDEVPLSASGKVDRARLPAPDTERHERLTGPRNETERVVAEEIYGPLLGIEAPDVHESFFLAGGNSLQATQLIFRASHRFDVEIALADFFREPTLAHLAVLIDRAALAKLSEEEQIRRLETMSDEEVTRLLGDAPPPTRLRTRPSPRCRRGRSWSRPRSPPSSGCPTSYRRTSSWSSAGTRWPPSGPSRRWNARAAWGSRSSPFMTNSTVAELAETLRQAAVDHLGADAVAALTADPFPGAGPAATPVSTASLAEFRARVRAALAEPSVAAPLAALRAATEREPDERDLYRALGEHGLLAVDWPVEYGGLGLTASHAAIAVEEMFQAGVPDTLQVNSIQIVGRFLLMAGTADQRKRYLPALARAELYASVLYTEPGAGSDLAALRTTAAATRDGFVLNGVKVFSLKGHRTDIALCAARTGEADERYEGITLFLIDMRAPGVRRTDIPSIAAEGFHRVELHDVAVGADQVIGPVGGGWPLLGTALAVERTGLDYALRARRWHAAAAERSGAEPADAERFTRFGVRVDAGLALAKAMVRRLDAGDVDETAFAASKYYTSELAADIATWAATLPAAATPSARVLDAAYLEAPGLTISAGTSEVMLRIVASTVLEDGYAPEPPETDDMARRLRAGLRDLLAEVPVPGDPHAPPADHGRNAPAWAALRGIDATAIEAPASAGGLEMGAPAGLVVMEELGRAGLGCPYAATALTVHAITASPEPRP